MSHHNSDPSHNGVHYFAQGWKLILLPGIRRFVILPLLINILLMGGAFFWLFNRLGQWIPDVMAMIPGWLQWLSYLIWPLVVLSIILVFSYFFSTVANWVAAPFCGLLSEQLEGRLTGKSLPDSGWSAMVSDLPRTIKREWQKVAYYLPRALGLLLLSFVPIVGQTAVPVLWFLFSAWMMSVQYCDFPFDNHKVNFSQMRSALKKHRTEHMQFGALVSLFTMIPLLNLVIMPVAVCGATAMWVDKYRPHLALNR